MPDGRIYGNGAVDTGRYNPRFIFPSDILPTPVFRFAIVQGQSICWFLRRNCSVTPAQLGWLYASLCALSLGVATFFWFQGAVLVLPFAWVELAAVGVAFFAYARHAVDGETISLRGRRLVVELECAGQLRRSEFDRDRVRVEPSVADRSLIELSGQGRRVNIGRYLRPELRPVLAQEIRRALREGAGQPHGDSGATDRR